MATTALDVTFELTSAFYITMTEGTDVATQLAKELSKNRELTKTLYTLRGEPPPNDHG